MDLTAGISERGFPKQNKNKTTKKQSQTIVKIAGAGDYRAVAKQAADAALKSLKPMVKQALIQGGGSLGSQLGGQLGLSRPGRSVGKSLGARLSKLIGSGDYEISDMPIANSLIKGSAAGSNGYAQFGNASQGTRVQHREYLQDVFTPLTAGTFGITEFSVNPGLPFTFPYLANIAQNFEEYKIRGLVFEYISTTSPYNTNSAMGSVIMAMEYNAAAPPFTSKPQMENSDFAISARLDKNIMYGVECASNVQNSYYVRNSASSLPLPMTDLGTFYVATQTPSTFPANSNIGELWVTYDVEFFRPRVSPARFGYYRTYRATSVAATNFNFGTAGATTEVGPFGSLTGVTQDNSVGGATKFSFPNADVGDTYMVTFDATLASQNFNAVPNLGSFVNCQPQTTAATGVPSLSSGTGIITGGTGSPRMVLVALIQITATTSAPASFLLTIGGTAVADLVKIDVAIVDIGNGIVT